MRLDKYLAKALNVTRSEASKLLKSKKIRVDDDVITDGSIEVKGKVYYLDKEIIYKENRYFILNKPKGYVSSTFDKDHPCVTSLIEGVKDLLVCGRLDIDTTGLLILTTDGAFIHKVTSPKSDIYKKYYVEVSGEFKESDKELFIKGFDLIDTDGKMYHTNEAYLEIIDKNKAYISISEGKFHQIKKMCHEVGCVVEKLKRVSIGSLTLDGDLAEGDYIEVDEETIKNVFVK